MVERNTAALLAALQALLDDPETNDRVVELADRQVRLERSPEPGVKFRLTAVDHSGKSEQWIVRAFDPADARPGSYPLQLPFLAGLPVMVWEPGPLRIAMALWSDVPEPHVLLSALVSASREGGWTGALPMEMEALPPQFISLSRGRARRVISFLSAQDQSMLTVSDSVAD